MSLLWGWRFLQVLSRPCKTDSSSVRRVRYGKDRGVVLRNTFRPFGMGNSQLSLWKGDECGVESLLGRADADLELQCNS